jgi:predicted secreted protein
MPAVFDLVRGFPTGTVFSVALYENPSTGYTWTQSVPTATHGVVSFQDTDYVQDPAPPGWVGVGGTRYFRYLTLNPGDTTITFLYRRLWEQQIAPLMQVTLSIQTG